MTSRLNGRQKRALKRHVALQAIALHKNPPTVAVEGLIRSSAKPHVVRDMQLYKDMRPNPLPRQVRELEGKLVGGKVKPRRPGKSKSSAPLDVPAVVTASNADAMARSAVNGRYDLQTGPNSDYQRVMRRYKNGKPIRKLDPDTGDPE